MWLIRDLHILIGSGSVLVLALLGIVCNFSIYVEERQMQYVGVTYAAPGSTPCGWFQLTQKRFAQSSRVKATSWQSRVF